MSNWQFYLLTTNIWAAASFSSEKPARLVKIALGFGWLLLAILAYGNQP